MGEGRKAKAGEVYMAYNRWAKDNLYPLGRTAFKERLDWSSAVLRPSILLSARGALGFLIRRGINGRSKTSVLLGRLAYSPTRELRNSSLGRKVEDCLRGSPLLQTGRTV